MAVALRDERGRLLPGQTANPYGRPPLAIESDTLAKIHEHFQGANREKLFASWQRLIDRGNVKAIELAFAYLAGRPKQELDIGAGVGLEITVRYVDVGQLPGPPPDLLDAGDTVDGELLAVSAGADSWTENKREKDEE
jgi:hypothetical protein